MGNGGVHQRVIGYDDTGGGAVGTATGPKGRFEQKGLVLVLGHKRLTETTGATNISNRIRRCVRNNQIKAITALGAKTHFG